MEFLKQNMSRLMGVAAMLLVFGWVMSFFQEGAQEGFVDFSLHLTKWLIIFLGVAIAALFVFNLATNKRLLIKTIVVVGLVSLLFAISYGLATDDISTLGSFSKDSINSYLSVDWLTVPDTFKLPWLSKVITFWPAFVKFKESFEWS